MSEEFKMGFSLEKVVPWGRSLKEYRAMFSLSDADLKKSILGCADGPASFNAELTEKGGRVISTDPIYQFCASEIKKRIDETYHEVMEQTCKNRNEFVWEQILSVEELGFIRKEAMMRFLADYADTQNRYVAAELPRLPFGKAAFDLALCSHFLFLYSDQFSLTFHIQSLKELVRVANEVRVFPLLELGSNRSRHIESIFAILENENYEVSVRKVDYEFQKGGNEMLCLRSTQ